MRKDGGLGLSLNELLRGRWGSQVGLARGTRACWCAPGFARQVAAGSEAPSRCQRVHPVELS